MIKELNKKDVEKLKKYLKKTEKNDQLSIYKNYGIKKGNLIVAYLIVDTTKKITSKKQNALHYIISNNFEYSKEYEQLKKRILEGGK